MRLIGFLLFGIFAVAQGGFNNNVPESLKNQIVTDLDTMKGMQGTSATPLFKEIFSGNFTGPNLSSFFEKRVKEIRMGYCGNSPAMVACVYTDRPTIMHVAASYVTFDMPQVVRLSVMLHESRHTEVHMNNWFHSNCPTPYQDENGNDLRAQVSKVKLEGMPACDQHALGAYGVGYLFMKNVELNCTNCTEKMKMDGKLFADPLLYRIPDLKERKRLSDDTKALQK